MPKIKKIMFINHPVLGDLLLDFSDVNGDVVDTIIFAGENGTGKSTILNALYKFATGKVDYECEITVVTNCEEHMLLFSKNSNGSFTVLEDSKTTLFTTIDPYKRKYIFRAIYSDVDINFKANEVNTVTSIDLDENVSSRRSGTDLPTKIKQLLVDIQAQDDASLSAAYRSAKAEKRSTDNLDIEQKMDRFTHAFNTMFESMNYDQVANLNSHKAILFKKNGISIKIDDLSSGEKQIVYRGCFLLKDVNALNGAFVFIDEPEISLHPRWQEKILDFYKGIFTGRDGIQSSQIFTVTHSPFIIHNDNRKNDKILVLERDLGGKIVVKDKASYYKCNSVEAVQDAFAIRNFSSEQSTVYLEGRTDEKYFKKALEVYDYGDIPIEFRWVGYIDSNNQEVNTGEKAVDKAYHFLVGKNLSIKNFCLTDCDTGKMPKMNNNVYALSIPHYDNEIMKKGIENALVLDNFDVSPFYTTRNEISDYGEKKSMQLFNKMEFCEKILTLPNDELKTILIHLKEQIDRIISIYNEE